MSTHIPHPLLTQLGAGCEALSDFLVKHKYPGTFVLEQLRLCADACQRNQARQAVEAFEEMAIGGMGTLNDFYPEVFLPGEDPRLAVVNFDALIFRCASFAKQIKNEFKLS